MLPIFKISQQKQLYDYVCLMTILNRSTCKLNCTGPRVDPCCTPEQMLPPLHKKWSITTANIQPVQ